MARKYMGAKRKSIDLDLEQDKDMPSIESLNEQIDKYNDGENYLKINMEIINPKSVTL